MPIIILFLAIPILLVFIDFIAFLFRKKRLYNRGINIILDIVLVLGLPLFYLIAADFGTNDCCSDSATFSPEHKLTIYTLIGINILAYFISTFKKTLVSPIVETLINSILLGGIILNIFIAIQVNEILFIFNIPIILLFILELIKNQQKITSYSLTFDYDSLSQIEQFSWQLLNSKLFVKIPILLVLCLPIMIVVSGFLMLFGQKPDSVIRAFTDTYKHGFSQLDYMCENVQCGGHFLCSVAANGHKNIVNPERLGERGGKKIMCNRQLLISNAFEELIQDKLPKTHNFIRRNYNKVGNFIHRYYEVFNLKIVSDIVYVLMKPLEWFFLITLYTFDKNPENRIAKQYLTPVDRKAIDREINS
ncbi:hypothetical protein H0I23_03110 [Cellulophaga sp. HaHaR_3_176]|uniref:DUF6688 domain-containing protein n=1 Tax=Cellulophaga sp. HaHaR_3_176 TaxID=1942464 RepID=UPI001C1F683B|nr:DUF6688 family protein [Cellulophaga sp. HaHaR_3_176]QWX84650.1 hypothetical protein H0I23_03110 [Cellulophaga sp. HaHaR_3_176]